MYCIKNKKQLKAFSTVEIILAIALFMVLVLGLASAMAFGVQQQRIVSEDTKATYLLEEGLEAVINIKDSNFATLVNGTYGLVLTANRWALQPSPTVIDGYTRTITITSPDTVSRDVTVTVSWVKSVGGNQILTATERLTDSERVIIPAPSWGLPYQESSLNLTGTTTGINFLTNNNTNVYISRASGTAPNIFSANLANPMAPVQTTSYGVTGTPYGLIPYGGYLYASSTNNSGEIGIMNTSGGSTTTYLNVTGNGDGQEIVVDGAYLYQVRLYLAGSPQFVIISLASPNAPVVTGSLSIPSKVNVTDIVVKGNYAYIGTNSNNSDLMVINIGTKNAPSYVGAIDVPNNSDVLAMGLVGDYIYLSKVGENVVYVYSIATAGSPSFVTSFDVGGLPKAFVGGAPNNNYLFMTTANTSREFQVWNIATPSSPTYFGSLDITNAITINDIIYINSLDRVVVGSSSSTLELLILRPN